MATARDVLREGIFWTTDLLEAADELVPVIRDRKPQVLITYNQFGGYGHPDHIQAHRVAMYGAQLAGVPSYRPDLGEPWKVKRILWTTMSKTRMAAGIKALREAGDTETFKGFDPEGGGLLPMISNDEDIAAVIDGDAVGQTEDGRPPRACRPRSPRTGRSSPGQKVLGDSMWSHEHYRFVDGIPFPDSESWADDIFAGLD